MHTMIPNSEEIIMLLIVISIAILVSLFTFLKIKFSYLSLRESVGILMDGVLAGVTNAKKKNNEKKKEALEKQLKSLETKIRYS